MIKRKNAFLIVMIMIIGSLAININEIQANVMPDSPNVPRILPSDHEYIGFDEDGNIVNLEKEAPDLVEEIVPVFPEYMRKTRNMGGSLEQSFLVVDYTDENKVLEHHNSFESAQEYIDQQSNENTNLGVFHNGQTKSVFYGVVNFNIPRNKPTTNYSEYRTNRAGYISGTYAADGAYLGSNTDGSLVKFMLSGVIGWVNKDDVQIVSYDKAKSVSYYTVVNGRLIHRVTTDISKEEYEQGNDLGAAPSYLKAGKAYYSYDGHYFYENYKTMISDYRQGSFSKAVNPNEPFYNYYQFLPHRGSSFLTAEAIDKYIQANTKTESKLTNTGASFLKAEQEYGANAALMLGVAINESGWGLSNYAQQRNNLFGHNAFDSNPDKAANYKSVEEGILKHATHYVSQYLNPKDWRYFGAHLGDEASGMNVKYASDPYWGEKAASHINRMERDGYITSTQKESIGIKMDNTILNARKEPKTDSKTPILYNTKNTSNVPFVILDKVKGTMVGGSDIWYKVLSDPSLSPDRNRLIAPGSKYDRNNMYVYVHSNYVAELGKPLPSKPTPKPKPKYKKGDVNGDGKITAVDYLMIRDSIMGKYKLTNTQRLAADVSGDGKITAVDYLMIRDYIMGKLKEL